MFRNSNFTEFPACYVHRQCKLYGSFKILSVVFNNHKTARIKPLVRSNLKTVFSGEKEIFHRKHSHMLLTNTTDSVFSLMTLMQYDI